VDREFIQSQFGEQIDFGACFVGKNLNLQVLRGYGRLDQLSCISAPDVFDQVDNSTGTQRALNQVHARDCRDYAIGAEALPPEESPRFFPEILLNARDTNVIELYNVEDPTELYEFDSFAEGDEVPGPMVGLRVDLAALEFPKQSKSPQISRVDGNHRLWGIDEVLDSAASGDGSQDGDDVADNLPPVAFSLLIGLNPNQEASLFRDINGEHKGMDVTHLAAIQVRISDPGELKSNPKWLPLWIADQLAQPGRAFENMVFYGGEAKGLKGLGEQRPVKLNSLKTTIAQQLKSAEKVSAFLGDDPDTLLGIIDNFWKAVRSTFPEAWGDKSNYILLQAIGLGAFAKFGASVIDTAYDSEAVSQEDFAKHLAPVKAKMSLRREDYPGIAGAGGAQVVAERLLKASEPDLVKAENIKGFFKGAETVDQLLGLQADDMAEAVEEEEPNPPIQTG
jgi:DGQHR domain-containing protein